MGSGVSCGRLCPEWHTTLLLSRSPRMEGAWKAPWDADGVIELVPIFLAAVAPLDVDHNLTGALIDDTVGRLPAGVPDDVAGFLKMGEKISQPGGGEETLMD